jgi:flagellin FlaB
MKTFCEILKRKDVGAIGIGAMIVFIAMVLVAGIAASVLVQTANRLEIQAMVTGEQTEAEVATGLHVFDIEGKVGSSKIQNLTITVRPRAGSKDIDLEQTVIEITDGAVKVLLSYNESKLANFNASVDADDGQVFGTGAWNMTNEEFGILVLEDADSSLSVGTPVINRGDLVMLTISCDSCFSGLDPRDDCWGMVMPEEGAPGLFKFRVPASLSDTVYDLY